MLENLDVTAHIFRVGTYKSAVEPFLRDNMSPEAKTDLSEWLGAMWHNYKQIVAKTVKLIQMMCYLRLQNTYKP